MLAFAFALLTLSVVVFLVWLHLHDYDLGSEIVTGLNGWLIAYLLFWVTCCFCLHVSMRNYTFDLFMPETAKDLPIPMTTGECTGGETHSLVYVTQGAIKMLQSKRGVKSKFVFNGVDTGIYCYPRFHQTGRGHNELFFRRGNKNYVVGSSVRQGGTGLPMIPVLPSEQKSKYKSPNSPLFFESQNQASNQLSPTTLALLSPSPSDASSEDSILANTDSETKSDPYNSLQDTDSDEGTEGNDSETEAPSNEPPLIINQNAHDTTHTKNMIREDSDDLNMQSVSKNAAAAAEAAEAGGRKVKPDPYRDIVIDNTQKRGFTHETDSSDDEELAKAAAADAKATARAEAAESDLAGLMYEQRAELAGMLAASADADEEERAERREESKAKTKVAKEKRKVTKADNDFLDYIRETTTNLDAGIYADTNELDESIYHDTNELVDKQRTIKALPSRRRG